MNRLYRVNDIDRNLRVARFRPLDVLVVGGTGLASHLPLMRYLKMRLRK